MKSEKEVRELREKVRRIRENIEPGSNKWHKFEALEVALDGVLEDNAALDHIVSYEDD